MLNMEAVNHQPQPNIRDDHLGRQANTIMIDSGFIEENARIINQVLIGNLPLAQMLTQSTQDVGYNQREVRPDGTVMCCKPIPGGNGRLCMTAEESGRSCGTEDNLTIQDGMSGEGNGLSTDENVVGFLTEDLPNGTVMCCKPIPGGNGRLCMTAEESGRSCGTEDNLTIQDGMSGEGNGLSTDENVVGFLTEDLPNAISNSESPAKKLGGELEAIIKFVTNPVNLFLVVGLGGAALAFRAIFTRIKEV